MIDLNTLISNALTAAVQQAVAPLNERIAVLESANDILHRVQGERIAALETKLTEANLFTQMTPATITADAFVTHLDQQEWFWHKIAGFVTNNSEITANDLEVLKDRVAALEDRTNELESETQGENRYLNRDDVASLIEEAMDDHTSTYDHDDYDNHIGDDDKHFDGDIEDAVRDALSNMTFDVSIR